MTDKLKRITKDTIGPKSNWTPLLNGVSNNKIFYERKQLILNWFDLWSSTQRCELFFDVFKKCNEKQITFIQNWLDKFVPAKSIDFTTLLPRYISLHIFSFLDPKSLCRASQVNWHWKFVSEQDILWIPRCMRNGWFLPYNASANEYGAWKAHYIAVVQTLDYSFTEKKSSKEITYGNSSSTVKLTNLIQLANVQEQKFMEKNKKTSPIHSKQNFLTLSSNSCGESNKLISRVIFISSNVPSCELLATAVRFEVHPIVYDYESSFYDVLINKLKSVNNNMELKSVGFIFNVDLPWKISLGKNAVISIENYTSTDVLNFFDAIASSLKKNASIHFFAPLSSTEKGNDLLHKLTARFSVTFLSPSGYVGGYNKIDGIWIHENVRLNVAFLYFKEDIFKLWINFVDKLNNISKTAREQINNSFPQLTHQISTHLIGDIIYEAFGFKTIKNVNLLSQQIIKSFKQILKNQDETDESLLECNLLQRLGNNLINSQQLLVDNDKDLNTSAVGLETDYFNNEDISSISIQSSIQSSERYTYKYLENDSNFKKRKAIVNELWLLEKKNNDKLCCIVEKYEKVCKASMSSNRPIISSQNFEILFSDASNVYEVSSNFLEDLTCKLSSWHEDECIGDVILKFCSSHAHLANLLRNYSLILHTYDKCVQRNFFFHGLVQRNTDLASCMLLSFPELIMSPLCQFDDYLFLTYCYQNELSYNHKDIPLINKALHKLNEFNQFIKQFKQKYLQENRLKDLEKTISKCPIIDEANRVLVHQLQVTLLEAPTHSIVPELRVYRRLDEMQIYLFNDSLMLASVSLRHQPFTYVTFQKFVFKQCVPLNRLHIENIKDSKYIKNAFRIFTPKDEWICSVASIEAKISWINILEKEISTFILK